MATHNPKNERIKRRYFIFLKEANRHNEATIDAVAKALDRFEVYTKHRDFKAFRADQAVAFKKHLADQKNAHSGAQLSKATLYSTLSQLKRFFQWLAWQPGYRSHLICSDADYFNLSEKESRIALARRSKPVPTMEQIKHVIETMPVDTDIQKRDRALIAFALLTGARDRAIASMRLKHVDIEAGAVFQDAREVETKFSKTFTTTFFPVGDEIQKIFTDWVKYLRQTKLWGNDDPLFPATRIALGAGYHFEASGIDRKCWSDAAPIRKIFKQAFEAADLPYFNPHSFRNTLVQFGMGRCKTAEEYKAWSQNLGHEQVLTTFLSYGEVSPQRQQEIIRGLTASPKDEIPGEKRLTEIIARALSQANAERKKSDD